MSKRLYKKDAIIIIAESSHELGNYYMVYDDYNSFCAKIKPEDVWDFILALRDNTKINKIKDECGHIQTEHLFDKLLYGNYIKLHIIDKVVEALEETFGIDKMNISRDKLLTMSVSCLSNLYSRVLIEKTKGKKHETGSRRKK